MIALDPQSTIEVQALLSEQVVCLTRALGLIYARFPNGMLLDNSDEYRSMTIWRADFNIDWSAKRKAVLGFAVSAEGPSARYASKQLLLPKSCRLLESFSVALRVDEGDRGVKDPSMWISLYSGKNTIQRTAYDLVMGSESLRAYKEHEVDGEIAEFIEDYLL